MSRPNEAVAALYASTLARRWDGVVAKRLDSPYQPARARPGRSLHMIAPRARPDRRDAHPTGLGKIVAVVLMLVGIGFVAFLTAAVAKRFVAQIEQPKPEWEDAVLSELQVIKSRLAAIEGRIPGS